MQRLEIGGRGYQRSKAAATITFTPLFDRAAIITELAITNPSAVDDWTLIVGGREVMRVRVDTIGLQQPFGTRQVNTTPAAISQVRPVNLFDWVDEKIKQPLIFPVPNGLSAILASVGGATADLIVEFREVDVTDISLNMLNHPLGNHFLIPIYGRLNATTTALLANTFDTQTAPPWIPNLFTGAEFPPGFDIKALGIFVEGEGRNTFSGAADHISATDSLLVTKNGQQMFTRTAGVGIPIIGMPAAAGSANTVLGSESTLFPPIQASRGEYGGALDPPLRYQGGDTIVFQWNLTGDATGGADYAHAFVVLLADIIRLS